MDAKTCEEYVLAELAKALAENERLKAELGKAKERLKAIDDVNQSALNRMVVEYGRRALFRDKTYTRTTDVIKDGEAKPVHGFPSSIDKTEFMAFFEPEFREAYDEHLEDEQ